MIKATIPWSAKQIAKMFDNNRLHFDNAIQRGNVWDESRKCLLIDSMLRGYPIPPMYTIKTGDTVATSKGDAAVFDCIDGKQRCNTIHSFRNNEFALSGLDPIGDIDLNGKTYDDLDDDLKDEFDSYSLTVYYFTDITDDEVCEMMSRLNNGKPLSGVENARIKAKNLTAIMRLAKHDLFTKYLSESSIKSYHNEDIVIKTILQIYENQFELSTKNVRNAYESLEITENQEKELVEILNNAKKILDYAAEILNDKSRKKFLKKISKKTNLVTIIYALSYRFAEGTDVDVLAMELINFFISDDEHLRTYIDAYNNASRNGTNHAANVIARNDALLSVLD